MHIDRYVGLVHDDVPELILGLMHCTNVPRCGLTLISVKALVSSRAFEFAPCQCVSPGKNRRGLPYENSTYANKSGSVSADRITYPRI